MFLCGSQYFVESGFHCSCVFRTCGVDYPRDTIVLNVFAPDRLAPSLGHFAIKLETYLRINKIKYQVQIHLTEEPFSQDL